MTQYFYVDESGEPGLRSQRSSPYYIIAMAQLPNREPIAELASLRQELHLAADFEFHFYQMKLHQKEQFFKSVQPLLFRVRAAALLKASIPLEFRDLHGAELAMELFTQLALRASPLDIANDILILDSVSSSYLKSLRIQLTRAYRQANRERPFKKLISSDSRHDDGLQVADMIAGAIRLNVWKNDPVYYQTFLRKMVDLWQVR
jgi:hypothetical protein